jgi:formylglycine-generating enzyme required for sulfatase activity
MHVSFKIADVRQRMRWIVPGRFDMGSPADEAGRYNDESFRHEVMLAEGFWLFDTPCTQALWQAVMGGNPSYFVSATRPVEQVSWDDAQEFISRINDRVPELDLCLPSEAQWEYACRAGTTAATYAGEMQILGENNAPVLDAIAWYSGNSGVDFELEDGWDSSERLGKQYEHSRAGTHPVGLKRPNAWGLYDMLGNVWEWCEDDWHDSFERVPSDRAWVGADGAALRVVRGGAWVDVARFVRAAFRLVYEPGDRANNLGFRCARVQISDPVSGALLRAGRSGRGERSEQAGMRAAINIPQRPWLLDRSPPGALLRADHGIVPFHGRNRELDELEKWCQDGAVIGLRLYTGAGGIGKSRLFIELCRRMDAAGWHAGFLANNITNAPQEAWSAITRRWLPLLLVIDYAETRRDELVRLLRELYAASQGPIRVVLLARAADDWWERLKTEGDGVGDMLSGPATRHLPLDPLAMSTEERLHSYKLAGERFAQVLAKAPPPGAPEDIGADHFKLVLLLHMTALAAIDGVEVKGDQGILDWMLDRERRFWLKQLRARSLPEHLVEALEEVMAHATLRGGTSSKRATLNLMRKAGLLQDETQAVRAALALLLHDTYPGTNWIEPILPDLLGEHLIQIALGGDAEKYFGLVFGPRDS